MNKNLSALLMLQILIVLLKLSKVPPFATWSWLWATSFFWIPFVIGVLLLTAQRLGSSKLKDITNKIGH